jgi:hypothetical protein
VLIVTAAAITGLVASSAQAAAPTYIIVSGPGLARPVLLKNWKENFELFQAAAVAPSASGAVIRALTHRSRLDLAHFWGWSGVPPPTSRRQANQHGQFYPAHGSQPAVIVITGNSGPQRATARLLEILAGHGIPTRL